MFDKLRRGPRQRKDRIPRILKDGTTTDIYGVVLSALSDISPNVETVHIQKIIDSVRNVIRTQSPNSQEISRILDSMSRISIDDSSSSPVIDWEKEESLLHITDPFFAFFLKWGKMELSTDRNRRT